MGTQNQTTTQLRGTQILDKSITQNDITLSGITKTNVISEDNIIISNENELYKVNLPEFIESIKAGFNISLSGTLSVSTTGYVKWSDRYIISSSGNGNHFSTNGYFYIETPLSGTITGVGGASNVTATSDGIPLSDWQSLYYILPIGSDSTSLAANFRITSTSSTLVIPHNWILLCTVNGLNHVYFFSNGVKLKKSQSIDLSINDSVNADKLDGFHLNEITGNSTTFYDGRYVNTNGDTMTGTLNVSEIQSSDPSSNVYLFDSGEGRTLYVGEGSMDIVDIKGGSLILGGGSVDIGFGSSVNIGQNSPGIIIGNDVNGPISIGYGDILDVVNINGSRLNLYGNTGIHMLSNTNITGNVTIGTTTDNGYKFIVSTNKNRGIFSEVSTPTISSNSTNYAIGIDSNITQSYKIDSGVTDNGYRMGLNIAAYSNTSEFKGTIGEQIGMRIQYGAYTSSGTGTISTAIGISLDYLSGYSSTSIANAYSIHSLNGAAKFYHQGNVLLGTTTDTGHKLNVNGDAIIGSTYRLKLMQFPGQGYWIDIPVGVEKASGIGHGGAGVNPWIAFAGKAGNWFTNSLYGDTCYRNTSGRLLFGNSAGASAMTIVDDRVGIGKVPVSPYKFEVSGDTNITGTLNVSNIYSSSLNISNGSYLLNIGSNTNNTTVGNGGNMLTIGNDRYDIDIGYNSGTLSIGGGSNRIPQIDIIGSSINITGNITVSSTAKVNNLHADKVDGFDFWSGSKSAYDAITTKSSTTIYIIT